MSVAKRFLNSSAFMMLGTGANSLVAFLVFVLLARLLDPTAMGLVFFALIFIELSRIIVFGGLPEAIIQRADWDQETASTCFWASMAVAVLVLSFAVGVLAPLMQAYYHPQAGVVLSVLSATLVIDGGRAIHEAKLRREFSYRMLAARGAIATLIGGVAGVALAYYGYGIWALVAHRVLASVVLTILTWGASGWRPSIIFVWPRLKELLPFMAHLTPARFLTTLNMKIPELAVGLVLGPAAAGIYRVGGRALEAIGQILLQPMRDAALPALSRLPDAPAVGAAYLRMTRIMAFIACPIYFGVAALAPDIVVLLFGPQWTPSGLIMSFLALGVGANVFAYFLQSALTATAQTNLVLRTSMVGTVVSGIASFVAVPFGAAAVAAANSLRAHLSVPFWLSLLAGRTQLDWREAVGAMLPFWAAAAFMAAVVAALRWHVWPDAALGVRLGAGVVTGSVLYAGILLMFARKYLWTVYRELLPLLPRKISRFLPQAPSQ